jgi:hypothetical protein
MVTLPQGISSIYQTEAWASFRAVLDIVAKNTLVTLLQVQDVHFHKKKLHHGSELYSE